MGDTLRLTGKIVSCSRAGSTIYVMTEVDAAPFGGAISNDAPITLEITMPDPPMPRCPLCGVTDGEVLRGDGFGIYACIRCGRCGIDLIGPIMPTDAEAIAAFRKIVREPK